MEFTRRDAFRAAAALASLGVFGPRANASQAAVTETQETERGLSMTRLFGRDWSADELYSYVGQMAQVAGVQRFELTEGKAKGVRCARVYTGSGFEFLVVPDRAMDIALASYNGAPLNYFAQSGIVAPEYFEPAGKGWDRTFFGGLNQTCGLRSAGHASDLEGRGVRPPRPHLDLSRRGRLRDAGVARGRVRPRAQRPHPRVPLLQGKPRYDAHHHHQGRREVLHPARRSGQRGRTLHLPYHHVPRQPRISRPHREEQAPLEHRQDGRRRHRGRVHRLRQARPRHRRRRLRLPQGRRERHRPRGRHQPQDERRRRLRHVHRLPARTAPRHGHLDASSTSTRTSSASSPPTAASTPTRSSTSRASSPCSSPAKSASTKSSSASSPAAPTSTPSSGPCRSRRRVTGTPWGRPSPAPSVPPPSCPALAPLTRLYQAALRPFAD